MTNEEKVIEKSKKISQHNKAYDSNGNLKDLNELTKEELIVNLAQAFELIEIIDSRIKNTNYDIEKFYEEKLI